VKLGWNLAAGFANSFWTAIVTLAAVPFYLSYLGIESYGLIGFFTAMQALFALLEVGLSQTINREVARSSTPEDRLRVRDLLHTLALAYWGVAVMIALATWACAPLISRYWLTSTQIPADSVSSAVQLMGLVVACRFPLSLYLGALMGAQRMVVASGIGIVMVTIANVGAVVVLALLSPTIQAFFVWHAGVGLANVVVVRFAAWRAVQAVGHERTPRFDTAGLRRIWRFTAGMGLTAVLGTIFMQSDKILLSKIVSLEDLGRYSLAGLAASILYLVITPVFTVMYPRIASLHADGDFDQIERLYRSGTRLLMAIICPVAIFIGMYSTELVATWTGNYQVAESIKVVIIFLLMGSVLHGAMYFPFTLQISFGLSAIPLLTNVVLLIIFIPMLFYFASKFGIAGGAAAWAALNFVYLLFGTLLTHRTILRGVGTRWLLTDVGLPIAISSIIAGLGGYAIKLSIDHLITKLLLGVILSTASATMIIYSSPILKKELKAFIQKIRSIK
jgi:O-antigen/teichoic acid export membrane protein